MLKKLVVFGAFQQRFFTCARRAFLWSVEGYFTYSLAAVSIMASALQFASTMLVSPVSLGQ